MGACDDILFAGTAAVAALASYLVLHHHFHLCPGFPRCVVPGLMREVSLTPLPVQHKVLSNRDVERLSRKPRWIPTSRWSTARRPTRLPPGTVRNFIHVCACRCSSPLQSRIPVTVSSRSACSKRGQLIQVASQRVPRAERRRPRIQSRILPCVRDASLTVGPHCLTAGLEDMAPTHLPRELQACPVNPPIQANSPITTLRTTSSRSLHPAALPLVAASRVPVDLRRLKEGMHLLLALLPAVVIQARLGRLLVATPALEDRHQAMAI